MATKKINFKTPFLDPTGEPIKSETAEKTDILLSEMLSQIIFEANINEGTLKFFDWGLELKKSGALTLDATDTESLQKFILNHQRLTVLGKGRLIEVLKA